jgi:hypothetical protein
MAIFAYILLKIIYLWSKRQALHQPRFPGNERPDLTAEVVLPIPIRVKSFESDLFVKTLIENQVGG